MKLIVFFLSLLVVSTFCNVNFLENPSNRLSKNQEISEFFDSLFNHFGLSTPNQIIDCFSDKTSELFFKSLYETKKLLKDTQERNSWKLHYRFLKGALLHRALEETYSCIAMTQDLTNLLEVLDIKQRNPTKLALINYIYYQAHYSQLLEGFKPVIKNLKDKNYSLAGCGFASIISDMIGSVQEEGSFYEGYIGFANGLASHVNIDDPDDSLKCFNNETAGLFLDFLYKLSKAVSDGKIQEGFLNTINFFQEEGKHILKKIPHSTWDCYRDSSDAKKLSDKLGVDITAKDFREERKKYMNDHRIMYYGYMWALKSALEDHNFNHAGHIYGRFTKSVASSSS